MRLPSKKRPGNPILAKDWNLLIEALEARTPRPSAGLELISTTGGFTYRARSRAPGSTIGSVVPLTIVSGRPPYIAAPPNPPAEGIRRYYIEWGTVNDVVAGNWNAHFDITATTYFFAKITFAPGDSFNVANWEIVTGSSYDSQKTPDWPVGEPRPEYMVVLLGEVYVNADGGHSIMNNGGGSLNVSEHITSISPGPAAGAVRLGKQLTYLRLSYA